MISDFADNLELYLPDAIYKTHREEANTGPTAKLHLSLQGWQEG